MGLQGLMGRSATAEMILTGDLAPQRHELASDVMVRSVGGDLEKSEDSVWEDECSDAEDEGGSWEDECSDAEEEVSDWEDEEQGWGELMW